MSGPADGGGPGPPQENDRPPRLRVAYLTADLFLPSQVAGHAHRRDLELQCVASVEALQSALIRGDVALALVDLSLPGLDPARLAGIHTSAPEPRPRLIAYGPHVHETRLAAAAQAGCDEVLTRGQFAAGMEEIVAQAARGSGEPRGQEG